MAITIGSILFIAIVGVIALYRAPVTAPPSVSGVWRGADGLVVCLHSSDALRGRIVRGDLRFGFAGRLEDQVITGQLLGDSGPIGTLEARILPRPPRLDGVLHVAVTETGTDLVLRIEALASEPVPAAGCDAL